MGTKSKKRISRDDELNENIQEDVCKNLMQLKQEMERSKATFTCEKNLLLELLNEELPDRRKLREALSELSKVQENVINDIMDICNEYRKNNQDTNVRKSVEEIEFIQDTLIEIQE